MTDGISDGYDLRIRCENCFERVEPFELFQVNNRDCCPKCGHLIYKKIIFEKKNVSLFEEVNVEFGKRDEEIAKLIRNGFKVIGWK